MDANELTAENTLDTPVDYEVTGIRRWLREPFADMGYGILVNTCIK